MRKGFGKPDICFKSKKIAIFCDSDFWHGKYYKEGINIPKTNKDYWIKKFNRNIKRDKDVNEILNKEGWKVLRFWESDIKRDIDKCVKKLKML